MEERFTLAEFVARMLFSMDDFRVYVGEVWKDNDDETRSWAWWVTTLIDWMQKLEGREQARMDAEIRRV